jgi:Phage integrase family
MRTGIFEDLDLVEKQLQLSKHFRAVQQAGQYYREWCESRNLLPVYPVSAKCLSAFVVYRCKELNGSAKTIKAFISKVKRYSSQYRYPWLDTEELLELGRIVNHLEYLDVMPTRRVDPIVIELLQEILKSPLVDDITKMVMVVGHDSLQRGGELCSGYQVSEFRWSWDYLNVTMVLQRSKCNRKGGPQLITIHDYGITSGARLLRNHFNRFNLWGRSDALVFPSYIPFGKYDFNKTMSTSQLRSRIKGAINAIGRDSTRFGGHSLRAGGATDLFRARVPYPSIKKFGRWKSDTALIYYRDEDKISNEATKGFRRILRNHMKSQKTKAGV